MLCTISAEQSNEGVGSSIIILTLPLFHHRRHSVSSTHSFPAVETRQSSLLLPFLQLVPPLPCLFLLGLNLDAWKCLCFNRYREGARQCVGRRRPPFCFVTYLFFSCISAFLFSSSSTVRRNDVMIMEPLFLDAFSSLILLSITSRCWTTSFCACHDKRERVRPARVKPIYSCYEFLTF